MTKVATGYAPKLQPGFVDPVREAVMNMTPEQFSAYETAIRATDYYGLSPMDQGPYTTALRAVNERRTLESETPFSVTVREGSGLTQVPVWGWVALGAGALFLVMAASR